jgi:hypothetical protein
MSSSTSVRILLRRQNRSGSEYTTGLSLHKANVIPGTGALSCVRIVQIMSTYNYSMK